MKKIIFVIILASNIVFAIENQTAWEIYAQNPTEKNANKVKKIAYSSRRISGGLGEKYLRILEQKIKELDKPSIELVFRVLSGYRTGWDGSANLRVMEAISKIIKKNPKLYLDSLSNVGAKECIGISNLGEEFVDKFYEQIIEYTSRIKILESRKKSFLQNKCLKVLTSELRMTKKFYKEIKGIDTITINKWKGVYLDKRENWMHGEIHNVNNTFIFFEDKECEFILDNKTKIECSISKTILKDDMPKDNKLRKDIENMEHILVTHRDENDVLYKHYFFKEQNGSYSFASWYFSSPTNASTRFYLKKISNSTPKFTNYQTQTTYTNPNKPLIQKGFGRLYRTRLKQAIKEKKPEFVGKYILAQWGCDDGKNGCTTGGIIDASTGEATEFLFKQYEHNGSKEIIYKLNSSLIVFAGDFKFKDGRTETNKVLFYEFKYRKFWFLKASEYK